MPEIVAVEEVMVRTEVVLTGAVRTQRLRLTLSPAGSAEQSRLFPNRNEARVTLLAMGLLPIDIQGTFDIMDANEPGTPISFGLKDLDENLLRENGFDV